jgi:hypothetical protein
VLEGEGVIETKFGRLKGSQAVPASPSGTGEACIRDLFNLYIPREQYGPARTTQKMLLPL